MPKVITREYDNTKSGAHEYSNFAVVVPGKVGNDYKEEKFDENGVYVCSSQKDFIDTVGVVNEVIPAKCATVEGEFGTVSEKNWEVFGPNGADELYVPEEITKESLQVAGKLICTVETTDEESGESITKWYKLTPAKNYDSQAKYARVITGNEGSNESAVLRGNQYAYDLLGLGYQVVYVKVTNYTDMEADGFFDMLKDRSNYDFRYITTGGYESDAAFKQICKLATYSNKKDADSIYMPESKTGRGDCTALIDVIENNAIVNKKTRSEVVKAIIAQVNGLDYADKYSAIFAPHVHYNRAVNYYGNVGYKSDVMYPASFNYLACASKVFETYNEWWAIAGYSRGVSPIAIDGTSLMLGEIAVNSLESRNQGETGLLHSVNVVTRIRNQYYLWGNRTAHMLAAEDAVDNDLIASHFLNIRQLCTTIKKNAYMVCKQLTFEPNSDLLWNRFCVAMTPVLEKMVGDQGVRAYKFVKVRDTRKALLKAKIKIVPIEAIEDFEIDLYLEDSIDGVTVNVDDN